MKLSKEIADWIREKVEKAGKSGAILGLSGGVDSTVAAALCKKALGDNILGLVLPCESGPEDTGCALKIAGEFNIKTKEVALDGIFNELVKTYPEANKLAKANLKPRLRMATLYYFANSLNYLVVGTGNKSELTVGYFTKYGDGGVDILPLGGLLKCEVKKLAEELGIPDEIICRPPSAGLWEGQTDEGEMGITYEELDKAILAIEKNETKDIDKEALSKVKKMIANSAHKRTKIPIFEK
jgi:NAD+ synthase